MSLMCPVCGKSLIKSGRSAVCASGHSFDYAKSGYLNLLLNSPGIHGDDKDMVKARTRFLQSGAYAFLRERLRQLSAGCDIAADLGCGEGYYTSALEAEERYGFDLSKDALKHAAKNDLSGQYTVASIFHLPLADSSCDMVLTCFAPLAAAEIRRILKPGGKFIFVTPGPRHLYEMKEILYEHPYENTVEPADTGMPCIHEETISAEQTVSNQALLDLFMMTPYAWKTEKTGTDRLSEAGDIRITCEFVIRIYAADH